MNSTANTIRVVIALTLITACGQKTTNDSEREIDPSQFSIIYNVLTDSETDNYEVFSMNLDGSEQRNITYLPGVEWAYHSFDHTVYFISDKDACERCYYLYTTDYQGNDHTKISDVRLADSWMSSRNNGAEIIIDPHRTVDSVFYILNMTGDIIQKVATGFPFSSDPLFVNNGEQIVFRGGKTKSKLIEGFNEELYFINLDGSGLRQLTHYPPQDTSSGKFGYKAGPPKLNPIDGYVTYQSQQNGKYSLYAVTLDGQKQWKLTDNKESEGWHDWSPDGRWLAIELFDKDQSQFHIGLMNWNTKEMKIITDTTYVYQQSPSFVLK